MVSLWRLLGLLLVIGLLLGGGDAAFADPPAQGADASRVLLAARTDLEALANALMGDSLRPASWTNSFDPAAASFVPDLRLDLELLAAQFYGLEERPADWFGPVRSTAWAMARDIRHDLELLADLQLDGGRPDVWIGADPLMRCDRSVQAMVMWLERTNSTFTLSDVPDDAAYCATVAQEVNLFVEVLAPGAVEVMGELRLDLDDLSRSVFGEAGFPAGWLGTDNLGDIRADLELLREAAVEVNEPVSAEAWIGDVFSAEWSQARDIRHDLELLADAVLGYNERTEDWSFDVLASGFIRCPVGTQNLLRLLQSSETIAYGADPAATDFCRTLEIELTGFVESGATDPGTGGGGAPSAEDGTGGGGAIVTTAGSLSGEALNPNAYLDRTARRLLGVIPPGTPFVAVARSGAENSRMMYVQGEGFSVWVGWPWTTVTEAQYLTLPLAENVESQLPPLLCYAAFCNSVVSNGNPMIIPYADAALDGGGGGATQPNEGLEYRDYGYTQQIILANDRGAWEAEFRMNVCQEQGDFGDCEPVLRLFENGELVQPIRYENGAPVWRMSYEFHGDVRMESARYYVVQLWVSVPSEW